MGFADSIKNFNKKVKVEVSEQIIAIATDLFTEIVNETPVDEGVLINNWYAGTGVGNYNSSYNEFSTSQDGMYSRMQIASLKRYTGFVGRDGAVSLSNSTPYAYRAEYIGWPQPQWSGRVGKYAMVAQAFIKVITKYQGL